MNTWLSRSPTVRYNIPSGPNLARPAAAPVPQASATKISLTSDSLAPSNLARASAIVLRSAVPFV